MIVCQLCGEQVQEADWDRHRVEHFSGERAVLDTVAAFERGQEGGGRKKAVSMPAKKLASYALEAATALVTRHNDGTGLNSDQALNAAMIKLLWDTIELQLTPEERDVIVTRLTNLKQRG
jgi:hypothetical protein